MNQVSTTKNHEVCMPCPTDCLLAEQGTFCSLTEILLLQFLQIFIKVCIASEYNKKSI